MTPVSFRIPHQKRSCVLKSAGNLTELFWRKTEKRKNNSSNPGFSCQGLPLADTVLSPYASGLSPCSDQALLFPVLVFFLQIQF